MRTVAVLTAALTFAGVPALTAQGGGQASRSAAVAPLAPLTRSGLAPARSILQRLVGTWRFEIWFAGNIEGPPDVSGTRVVSALFDDLRVEWIESIDHSPVHGQGIMGFDSRSERFFSTAVFNAGSGAELMTGTLDLADGRITFTPIDLASPPDSNPAEQVARSSALSMLDANHFSWVALDRAWRALFTRQPPPPPRVAAPPTPADSAPSTPPDSALSAPPDSAEVMTGP